jgi:hypothetical protein
MRITGSGAVYFSSDLGRKKIRNLEELNVLTAGLEAPLASSI